MVWFLFLSDLILTEPAAAGTTAELANIIFFAQEEMVSAAASIRKEVRVSIMSFFIFLFEFEVLIIGGTDIRILKK